MFEHFNGFLLQQVKNSQDVPQQIGRQIDVFQSSSPIRKAIPEKGTDKVKDLCHEMRNQKTVKKVVNFGEVTALASPNVRLVSSFDQAALHTQRGVPKN